jgi:hypothetical protein
MEQAPSVPPATPQQDSSQPTSVPLMEQAPSAPPEQMPTPSSPGLPEPIPAQTTTPLLPLTPDKN